MVKEFTYEQALKVAQADHDNLLYRDNLYKELGIYETMQKAYEEVWK